MMNSSNFAEFIVRGCLKHPESVAVRYPIMDGNELVSVETATFSEINLKISGFQQGLKKQGFNEGDRIIFVIRPSVSMYCLIIACIASGLVPVFVDMGMGFNKIKMAIEDSKAKAIFGMRKLLRFYWLMAPLRKMIRYNEGEELSGCIPLESVLIASKESVEFLLREPADHCLITFTSGSTGRPKGADRTHEGLIEQHLALKAQIETSLDDNVMSCFPVSVLHYLACGLRSVLPEVDFTNIGSPNAARIVKQIEEYDITAIGSAPAFLAEIVKEYEDNNVTNDRVRVIVMGGSTVPTPLAKRCSNVFPSSKIHVCYGSTESEPISHIELEELAVMESDGGYLVGKPVLECEVIIVRLAEQSTYTESDILTSEVPNGSIGEIVVSGKHVLKQYIDNPKATAESKIPRDNELVWHRTGDLGYLDEDGNIWLTGRDKDLLHYEGNEVQNYPIEKQIDKIDGVTRGAIIQCQRSIVLVLETDNDMAVSLKGKLTEIIDPICISEVNVFVVDKMPVDGRHNSKVDRPLLRQQIDAGKLTPIYGPDVGVDGRLRNPTPSKWLSGGRFYALATVTALILFLLTTTQDSIFGAIAVLAVALYIQIPVVIGGVLHMFFVSNDWLPQLKVPLKKTLFGANKTWRGAIVVPLLTVFGAFCLYPLEKLQSILFGSSVFGEESLFWVGIIGGIGYILGELPNSMLKRKLGIAAGETPKSFESFFIALDQIDSAAGVAILYFLFLDFSFVTCVIYAITFPFTALLVKYYLHKFQLKDRAC